MRLYAKISSLGLLSVCWLATIRLHCQLRDPTVLRAWINYLLIPFIPPQLGGGAERYAFDLRRCDLRCCFFALLVNYYVLALLTLGSNRSVHLGQ